MSINCTQEPTIEQNIILTTTYCPVEKMQRTELHGAGVHLHLILSDSAIEKMNSSTIAYLRALAHRLMLDAQSADEEKKTTSPISTYN